MSRYVTRYALLLLCLLSTNGARAHAPPHGIALLFRAQDGADSLPTVLTNRGLMFAGSAAADPFSVRCSEAYGATTVSAVHALYDAADALAVATTETVISRDEAGGTVITTAMAVRSTRDRGCSWQESSGLPALPLGGLTRDPSAPATLLLSTFDYQQTSGVFASVDEGRSWVARARNAPATVYKSLLAARDGRVYAGGDRFDLALRKLVPIWSSSSDRGATWNDVDTTAPRFPLGVAPYDAELVFAREELSVGNSSAPRDRLLRSEDGGKTFTSIMELGALAAFASTPDGSVMWIGGQQGLYRSLDQGKTFTRVDEQTIHLVTCLQYRQGRLWTCANMNLNTNGVWVSADEGATFREVLTFDPQKTRANRRVQCTPEAQPVCEEPWRDYERELLGGGPSGQVDAGASRPSDTQADGAALLADSGPRDGGPDSGDAAHNVRHDGAPEVTRAAEDGCSLTSVPGTDDFALLGLLSALAALLYTRRARAAR